MKQSKKRTGGRVATKNSQVPIGYFDVYKECRYYMDTEPDIYEKQNRIKKEYKTWVSNIKRG